MDGCPYHASFLPNGQAASKAPFNIQLQSSLPADAIYAVMLLCMLQATQAYLDIPVGANSDTFHVSLEVIMCSAMNPHPIIA